MFCPRCGTWASDEAAHCPLCGAPLREGVGPAPERAAVAQGVVAHATPAVQYAGFWRRFAAVLIDSVLLWFPSATVRVLLGLDPFAMFDAQSPTLWASVCFEYFLGWLYAAILIGSPLRGTLGLQVMDLQVADLHGNRVSFARASWRYFAQLLTLFTFGLGYLLQLMTPRRQTLHDLVSGTVVVRARHVPQPFHPAMRMSP